MKGFKNLFADAEGKQYKIVRCDYDPKDKTSTTFYVDVESGTKFTLPTNEFWSKLKEVV